MYQNNHCLIYVNATNTSISVRKFLKLIRPTKYNQSNAYLSLSSEQKNELYAWTDRIIGYTRLQSANSVQVPMRFKCFTWHIVLSLAVELPGFTSRYVRLPIVILSPVVSIVDSQGRWAISCWLEFDNGFSVVVVVVVVICGSRTSDCVVYGSSSSLLLCNLTGIKIPWIERTADVGICDDEW